MAAFLKNITLISQSAALFRDEKLKEVEVSGYQAKYLLAVSNAEGISQEGLAKRLLVNKSNVARQVGALEAAGYLRREQSAEDKRVMLVYTTEKGRNLVPAIRAANAKWREIVCEGLTDGEREQLERLAEKLVQNARRYLNSEI